MEAPTLLRVLHPENKSLQVWFKDSKTHTGSKPKGVGLEPTPNIPLLLLQTSNLPRGKKRATCT